MRWFAGFSLPRVFCAFLVLGLLGGLADSLGWAAVESSPRPSDWSASRATVRLFDSLRSRPRAGIYFGQHDAPLYGLDANGQSWRNTPGTNEDRSDVQTATGSHPALVGFDVDSPVRGLLSGDPSQADFFTREIRKARARGQIITLSWHAQDPIDGTNFSSYPQRVQAARRARRELKDRDPSACAHQPDCAGLSEIERPEARRVAQVLPGGVRHLEFLKILDAVADLLGGLRDESGEPIPVIFRPWHEHNGSWFWWGGEFRSTEEFVQLWQLTVSRLRDTRGLHHLLWAYSPNQSSHSRDEYWNGYPGDDFVDVLGFDAYHALDSLEGSDRTGQELGWIVRAARARGKVPALTETGLEAFRWGPYNQPSRRGESNPRWFTQNLERALRADPDALGLAYLMVWRNASMSHHYFPAPSERETIDDFLQFRRSCGVLLLEDLR